MNTLQLQKEMFKSWFDTTIAQQFQLRQELVGQTLEGIFYTSKVEGWDIDLEGSGVIHLPLGYLTLETTTGKLYRIDTNYQSWCGGIFGILLSKIDVNETHNATVFPLVNQLLHDEIWDSIKGAKIKQIDWNWKRETNCKLDGQILSIKKAYKYLSEDSFVPENLVFHFDNDKSIFFFALEPDEQLEDKKSYTLIGGGEEILIFFDKADLKHWNINTIGFQIRQEENSNNSSPVASLERKLSLFKYSYMGLFNLFKKPTIVQDDLFGALRFVGFKDSSKNYFEGKGHFKPTDSITQYLIQADKDGPTDKQKQFYIALQSNFTNYIQKIKPLIEDEFRNWKEGFEIKNFNKEFELVCITIPRLDNKPVMWDMAFTTIHDLNHHITIDFIDDNPTSILIDG